MQRITDKQLDSVVTRINVLMKAPLQPYTRADNRNTANVGNYHLSFAYGGVSLHRMNNESGGVVDIFSIGHVTRRELYELMHAYIKGINAEGANNG